MTDYTGKKCIICNKEFTDKDDIVVCPVCGTPYHRECYNKVGKCINTELHEKGISWHENEMREVAKKYEDSILCPNCGQPNDKESSFCKNCGMPLKPLSEDKTGNMQSPYTMPQFKNIQNTNNTDDTTNPNEKFYGNIDIAPYLINFSDPLCGYNPDEDFDGVKLGELGAFVENNTHYYLPMFKRLKLTGKSLSLNFTAMLFPELYFANRKMPLIALIFIVLKFIISIPNYIITFSSYDFGLLSVFVERFNVNSSSFQMLSTLSSILGYAIMFVGGGFANHIYYKYSVSSIKKIKKKTSPENVLPELKKRGGTSVALLITFIVLMFVPVISLYCYMLSV